MEFCLLQFSETRMTYGITFGDLNLHEKWLVSVRAEQPGLLASCRTFERWPGIMVHGWCKDISQTFTLSFMDAMRVVQGAGGMDADELCEI
jgi:hypothetical protein